MHGDVDGGKQPPAGGDPVAGILAAAQRSIGRRRLRNAANRKLSETAERILDALAKNAAGGDMKSTKLLLDLSFDDAGPAPRQRMRTLAEILGDEDIAGAAGQRETNDRDGK